MNCPPLPLFIAETASQKARMAQDAWNTRDPARVALAYTATAGGETVRNSCSPMITHP